MEKSKYDLLGPALAKVGEEIMEIVGGEPYGVYLYVEAGDGWVGPSLYKNDGQVVRYFSSQGSDLCNLLLAARELEEPDKRWATMQYTVEDGHFDAEFGFSEEIDREELVSARRKRLVRARFGDKPIVYPPAHGFE